MSKIITGVLSIFFLIIGIVGGYLWGRVGGGVTKDPSASTSCKEAYETAKQDLEKKLKEKGLLPPQGSSDSHVPASTSVSGKVTEKGVSSITFLAHSVNPLEEDVTKVIRISGDTKIVLQKMKDSETWKKEMEEYKQKNQSNTPSSPGENPAISTSVPKPFVEEVLAFDQIKVGDMASITLDESEKDLAKVILIFPQKIPNMPNPSENTFSVSENVSK